MPKKPTQRFGSLVFAKDGKVRRKSGMLSPEKGAQEAQAIQMFGECLRRARPLLDLVNVRQLSEANHDFEASVGGERVVIQLAELVDRSFVSANPRPGAGVLHRGSGAPEYIDQAAKDKALWNVVAGKLAKRYAKPANTRFWLVVFSTQFYLLEYADQGAVYITEALSLVRERLASEGSVFDEVWFTDLQTAPIRVWPFAEPQPEVRGGG